MRALVTDIYNRKPKQAKTRYDLTCIESQTKYDIREIHYTFVPLPSLQLLFCVQCCPFSLLHPSFNILRQNHFVSGAGTALVFK